VEGLAVTAATLGRRLAVLPLLVAMLALLVPVLPVRAADAITLDGSAATATYNQAITFTVRMTAPVLPSRVEIRLGFPQAIGPYIADVALPASPGTTTLRYTLDITGDGHIVPNTPITATWAAIPAGGGAAILSAPITFLYQDTTQQWQSLKGSIVTVHWTTGPQSFAKRALAIAEKAIADASALLGVTETEPVDFFIYADNASFRAALGPGTRENVGGTAHSDIRTLFALLTADQINDPWVGIVIPHELTHLVMDTAVRNPYRYPPRWLDEGVAVYLTQGYDSSDRALVTAATGSGDLLPLTALTGQFPTDPAKTSLAYAESVSAIDYLVRTYGKDALVKLILAYAEGPTDDEALTAAIGVDMAGFQQGWYTAIGASTPQKYGPQPAPPGPLPPGWDATVPGASPGVVGAPAASAAASPTTSPATPAATGGNDGSGWDMTLVLLTIVVVAGAMLAGLVLAGRRTTRS
jgi:hypothetical protein